MSENQTDILSVEDIFTTGDDDVTVLITVVGSQEVMR